MRYECVIFIPSIFRIAPRTCQIAVLKTDKQAIQVTKIASGFLGVVVLIALAAGGGFYAFAKQKQKKQAEKEALDPDANYTEDKGDFEIPVEDEPEETGEEDNAEE